MDRLLSNYQIDLPGPYYAVCLVHTTAASPDLEMEPFLLVVSVKKLAEEQLMERWRGKLFTYLGNTVLIAQLTELTEVTSLTDSLDRFCRLARRLCGAAVTIGIGTIGGVVLGVFLLRIIFVSLNFLSISGNMQYIIKGIIILLACSIDMRKYLTRK